MLKKIIAALLSGVMLMPSVFANGDIEVYLDGSKIGFDQPPIIYNDRTMVPMRAIFEALGLTVQWFEEDKRVTAYNNDIKMTMYIGDDKITLNKKAYKTDTAPIIIENRTLVPLRAISELLNSKVEWDGENRVVTIDTSTSEYFKEERLSDRELEKKILELTNIERAKWGRKPLVWNDTLADTARMHSQDMADRGFFSHENPDGQTPFDRMTAAGINYKKAAENIAAGQATPEAAMQSWINSKGHLENIMREDLEELGVGIARGGKYGIYWTQNFAELKK